MTQIEAPNLHDFTLLRLAVAWEAKTAALELIGPTGPLTLSMVGLKGIELTRDDPWGPSASVNKVEIVRDDEALLRIEVEMQTGDVIRLRCAEVR